MVRTRRAATKEHNAASSAYFRALVTGANAGLGYATCRRLISEFLSSRPEDSRLHLIVGTRSAAKSASTISKLSSYVSKQHGFLPASQLPSSSPSSAVSRHHSGDPSTSRVLITSVELDLTELPSVIRAARRLRRSVGTLDSLVCNAGIAGWTGLNWWRAIVDVLLDLHEGTTWPSYLISALGLRTGSQLGEAAVAAAKEEDPSFTEPALGRIFCANVFGHYILAHELGPLLSAATPHPGRIVWLSSIEATAADLLPEHLAAGDLQAQSRDRPYNSSKRVTDVLALTASLKATRSLTRSFFSDPSHDSYKPLTPQPRQYLAHPGVVSTEIIPLLPPLAWAKRQSFYLARLLGSPWHTIDAYKGACAPVWLSLAPQTTLDALEEKDGVAKWGSATDVLGRERVKRTEVEGWGWGGRVEKAGTGSREDGGKVERLKGRRKTAKDVTEKELEDFEKQGVLVWKEFEKLREDWYELMEDAGVIDEEDDDE